MMILTRGKIVIIVITIGIVASLAGMVQFSSIETGVIAPLLSIALQEVSFKQLNEEENVMTMVIDFAISNKSEKTLTISRIEYELYADERFVGRGYMSLEDIPMVGRPQLFPGSSTVIPTDFRLKYSDEVADLWNTLASGGSDQISWRAKGSAEIESAFSIIPVEFESSL